MIVRLLSSNIDQSNAPANCSYYQKLATRKNDERECATLDDISERETSLNNDTELL